MNFQLNSVIEVLLSNDNQRRIEAENYINQIPVNFFDLGIDAFLASMNNENENVASMGALLLKKKYLDVKTNLERIPTQKLVNMVTSVKNSMSPQRSTMFLKRCCEILVRIYTFANIRDELMNVIEQLNSVEVNSMKLALMYFIEIVCQSSFNDELLLKYSANLEAIFQKGLNDSSNQIKVAAFKTLTIFLSSIEDQKMIKKFNTVLKVIISKAIELIRYDQQSGIIALQSLNELTESHPKFIKPIFDELLMIYAEIMEAPGLLVNLRSTALSGIFSLCHEHHTLVRKSSYFKTKMVASYMNMLAEIDQSAIEEWAEELMDEVISKNDISMITEEHILQIANQLGNKFMLPLFIPFIKNSLSSTEIKYQHAGLTALAILVQNCHQSYKKQLSGMISLMLPLLQSQNSRIIYDILVTMGYMASQFAPEIQIHFGEMILNFIKMALKHPTQKIQYKAALCIVNFQQGLGENNEVKVIQPHLDEILTDLAKIFEFSFSKSNYIMLEGVLSSIATIASTNNFLKYYQTFMPGLIQIITLISNDTPQKVNIKSKTIESMGDLLASIKDNKELFVPECNNIMQSLITLQNQIDKEDSLNKAIFMVFENVVEVLKQQFIGYSDSLFERVYEAAARKIDIQYIDETETQKNQKTANHKYVKIKLDLKLEGVKTLVLNTETFEQKVAATNLLSAMAENMGHNFIKYIEFMFPLIDQLIVIKNSKQMRANMIDCCKFMVLDGRTNEEKNMILARVYPMLKKSFVQSIRVKDHSQVSSIVEAYSISMPFMSQQQIDQLPEIMLTVLGLVKSLTSQIEKIYSEKEMDDDIEEQMNNETDEVQEPLEYVENIINQAKGNPKFEILKSNFPKDYEFQA